MMEMTDDGYTVNKKRNIYYNCISDDCNNLLIKKKKTTIFIK